MSWIILSILGVVTSSITRILQKKLLSHDQSDPYAFGIIFQLFVSLLSFIFVLFIGGWEFPNFSGLGFNLVIMCVFYALANVFMFKAFKVAAASEVSIILISSTMWSVITAIVVLGEKLSIKNIIGILLIIGGVLVIQNGNLKKFHLKRAHLYAIASAILYGMAFINDMFIVKRYHSILSYMVFAFALPALTILLLKPQSSKHLKHYFTLSVFFKLIVCAFFYTLSALFVYSSYKAGGQASVISCIEQSNVIFTVILAYVLLKEREQLNLKIVGTILTFCGVLLLI